MTPEQYVQAAAAYQWAMLGLGFLFVLIGTAAFAENTRIGRHISGRLLAWLTR